MEKEQLVKQADWLFRKAARKFVKERDKVTIEGLTLPAFQILTMIVEHGDQRLVDLAEALDFTSGAITAHCDKLEKKQFVLRVRDTADRRTIRLSITDKGRTFLQKYEGMSIVSRDVLFRGFTDEELAQHITFYERLIENLHEFSPTLLTFAEDKKGQ